MSGSELLAAIGLLLVIEGILPFAVPAVWREGFSRILELNDGPIAFYRRCLDDGRRFFVVDAELK